MDCLRVNAFGKLRMQFNGAELTAFPTRHVEELLGFLLLHPQQHHNREKLIEMLWPHSSRVNVRARFSTVLWRLRRSLDSIGLEADDCLEVSRQALCFLPPADWSFDVQEFQDALQCLRRQEDDREREQILLRVVASYRGELFDGLYANWCLLERERLARLYLRAAGQLMLLLMRRKAYEEALTYGHSILEHDPLREEVHRALMYCYWQLGQFTYATEQYQTCAELLMNELRILPRQATVDLYQQIMTDRFATSQTEADVDDPAHVQLQHAFAEFQMAGQRLSRMLIDLETHQTE